MFFWTTTTKRIQSCWLSWMIFWSRLPPPQTLKLPTIPLIINPKSYPLRYTPPLPNIKPNPSSIFPFIPNTKGQIRHFEKKRRRRERTKYTKERKRERKETRERERRKIKRKMYVKAVRPTDLNRNTEWFTYPGVWTTYILILFFSWLIVLSVLNCSPGLAWTIVHLSHFLVLSFSLSI